MAQEKGFVLTAGQKSLLRQALQAAEASMHRAIKAKVDRPEFRELYERDIATLRELKVALGL